MGPIGIYGRYSTNVLNEFIHFEMQAFLRDAKLLIYQIMIFIVICLAAGGQVRASPTCDRRCVCGKNRGTNTPKSSDGGPANPGFYLKIINLL